MSDPYDDDLPQRYRLDPMVGRNPPGEFGLGAEAEEAQPAGLQGVDIPDPNLVKTRESLQHHLEDGSIVVDFDRSRQQSQHQSEFGANLADVLPRSVVDEIGQRILEFVKIDEDARQDWHRRLKKGMEILGIKEPVDDGPFDGAASVTHPLLMEACVNFQARAITELFPAEGPVKGTVLGERTEELDERSDRVKDHMNYQLVYEDESYFWETDQATFMLPIAGSVFKKVYRDPVRQRNISRLVKAEDLLVPYNATTLETAPRYTHRIPMASGELKKQQHAGVYRDIELTPSAAQSTTNTAREAYDEADDRTPSEHEADYQHMLFECHIDWEFKELPEADDGLPLPYVITVEETSGEVLAIRRNWREGDELARKRVWFVHNKYLPGVGFYGFGLLHAIGSLSQAVTGTVRALLDSAAFATMQGGFKTKEARASGSITIRPGEWQDIEMSAEEISKAFYTPPFKEPSVALLQLLGALEEAGQRFASTTEAMVGDASNNAPVGTTIALIEQGSKVHSAIHKRGHIAAGQEFRLLFELNRDYVPEEGYPIRVEGRSLTVYREDYDERVDVVPVSDPNIFSSTQRIAGAQASLDLAERARDLYDMREVHRRVHAALKTPDIDGILLDPDKIEPVDPVTENQAILVGRPIRAFPDQDHQAHIQVHMAFMQHPEFGGNPQAAEMIGPAMMAHMAEHMALLYGVRMAQLRVPTVGVDLHAKPGEPVAEEQLHMNGQNLLAQIAAQVSDQFAEMAGIPAPEPPPDPEMVKAQAEIARKDMAAQAEMARKDAAHQTEMARQDDAHQRDQLREDQETGADIQRKDQEAAAEMQRKAVESEAEIDRKDEEAEAEMDREAIAAVAEQAKGDDEESSS